jgi:hypothetical protein
MTQSDRFLQFLRARAEREIREVGVLVRIENDELVITNRHRIAGAVLREMGDTAEENIDQRAVTSTRVPTDQQPRDRH